MPVPLSRRLDTTAEHKVLADVNRLVAELQLEELADNCGQKPERLWYGNNRAEVQENKEYEPVPQFLLEDIAFEEISNFVASDITQQDLDRCKWLLSSFLRPSEDGEYESYYVPVMAACAGVGEAIFDDWVEWVLSGTMVRNLTTFAI